MLLFVGSVYERCDCEVFTSMADMERIVMREKFMVDQLKKYVEAEEEKLKGVKEFMEKLDGILVNGNVTKVKIICFESALAMPVHYRYLSSFFSFPL